MVDLGKVVIFAGEPKDGGVGMAARSCRAGAGDGGCGFEGGIERAAKQTDLLAGQDGSGALGERCKRGRSGWRWILRGQEANQLRPVRGEGRPLSTDLIQR